MRLKRKIFASLPELDGDSVYLVIPLERSENDVLRDFLEEHEDLSSGDDIEVKIKKKRKGKSLDANAYCWILIKELSKKLQISYTDCYRQLIREGGEFEVFPVRNEAVNSWINVWESRGLGWVCEDMGASKLDGYTNIRSYYGISVYDTKQMARFIDVVIDACKDNKVPTASKTEIERYKREWK